MEPNNPQHKSFLWHLDFEPFTWHTFYGEQWPPFVTEENKEAWRRYLTIAIKKHLKAEVMNTPEFKDIEIQIREEKLLRIKWDENRKRSMEKQRYRAKMERPRRNTRRYAAISKRQQDNTPIIEAWRRSWWTWCQRHHLKESRWLWLVSQTTWRNHSCKLSTTPMMKQKQWDNHSTLTVPLASIKWYHLVSVVTGVAYYESWRHLL